MRNKFLITAELRDLEEQVAKGEISYSYMIEVLNEKAEKWFNEKLKAFEIGLIKLVKPGKLYRVSYTIKHDGTKVNEPDFLLGKDLTENQIIEVFKNGQLTAINQPYVNDGGNLDLKSLLKTKSQEVRSEFGHDNPQQP